MYGTRYIVRPTCGRVAKMASPAVTRNLSYVPAPFYPRFAVSNGFGDVFRLLDESSRFFENVIPQSHAQESRQQQVFTPRFDIQEVDGAYQLRGELPGVEAENLEVQFIDPKTLVISGRSERQSSSGTPLASIQSAQPVAHVEGNTVTQAENSDTASVHSSGSNFQKATVEDDYVDAGEEASLSAEAKALEPAADAAATEAPAAASVQAEQTQQPQEQQHRYWVSERSVGSFSRTFNFPASVDQDGVTASLKNGILDIVVPKAKIPQPRRISVL